MNTLKQAARAGEAVEVFQRYRTTLRAERGAEPSAATQEL